MKALLTQRSLGDLETASRELADNALVLHPELSTVNLLEHVIALAEPEFLADLDKVLRAKHFLRIIRLQRAQRRSEQCEAQWLFPEIRAAALLLPLRVPIGDGKSLPRGELRFSDTGRYLKVLDKRQRDLRRSDGKRAAIVLIRKLWPRTQRAHRMTLAEVDVVRARRAGLIE
jgi:hypothetical protein